MKVLQINVVCGVGSTGRIATDLYHIIKQEGHQCKIAYGRGEAMNILAEDGIRIGNDMDMKAHALMTRITDKTGFYSKRATLRFIEWVKGYDPDVVHLHNIHGYYINIEVLVDYLKEAKKKVIWTLHDCWGFTGHCSHFDYIGCEKWKVQCSNCVQKQEYPKSLIKDNSKYNYQKKKELFSGIDNMTIVTPSKWLAELANQSYLGNYPVEVIHNGINLEKFKIIPTDFKERMGLTDKKIVLGVTSMWEPRKGLQDFIKLSELLDEEYKIVLVGLSEKQKQQLPKDIMGITRTNNVDELIEIYNAADVFVNPTYEDNFPTTNLESLACGTPVITYDTGGSVESVNSSCGSIVDKGNIESVNQGIAVLLEMDKRSLKENCASQSKRYDKIKKFKQYIDVYKEVIL